MELYFLRHADAGDRDPRLYPDDADRPLSSEGVEDMRAAAAGMKRAGFKFDRILSSPYARARQTAELAARETGWEGKIEFFRGLIPEAAFRQFAGVLTELSPTDKVLFVGHEPSLPHLVSVLISPDQVRSMRKGGMALVDLDDPHSPGRLRWVLSPEEISRLS